MNPALPGALNAALGSAWAMRPLHASGFCDTWRADGVGGTALFVKTAPSEQAALLRAEAQGLAAIAATRTVRTPEVLTLADLPDGGCLLAMRWLDLAPPDAGFGARLGEAIAALHARPQSRYGWETDNFIGATPQTNGWTHGDAPAEWLGFWREQRLGIMRQRLAQRGAAQALLHAVDAVCNALPGLFADGYAPRPSLIHGDLWSGNWGMLEDGTPVIYDPAVSCADHEAELAMMELFGSPPAGFWQAYGACRPLHPGYARRRALYQLYHLLNHAQLFGGGYARQALACAEETLRATGQAGTNT